ncbi:DUF2752 domain-containing protein [Aequorivita sp. F47161]|uniref:DUF2752 domain-containing protein n=1 Tax=Aequorivita vitellina TaxID=2874475 RepID=A0A9X1U1Y1_9FLAO|nr:DUF2752 domain-containing protein [Aequorivita vitellina]MCG2420124.1 DUF2752 domain-containing protein [Aequorivita vitellina]
MQLKTFHKIGLITVLLLSFVFVYYFFNPASNFFIPCPFHYLTGFYCPGCGSQRAIHLLLHGDVFGAFRFNPLMVLTLPILIYGLGLTLANWIFGTQKRFMLFYSKLFIFGYFGLAILFWILRNLPFYPFNLLAPTA